MTMADTTAQLQKLEAEEAAAQEHERATAAAAHEASTRGTELADEVARLSAADPSQFGPEGGAKPKTDAARLVRELEKVKQPEVPWLSRVQAAEARLDAAEQTLRAFKAAHIEELVSDLEPLARKAATQVESSAKALVEAITELFGVDHRVTQAIGAVQGLQPHEELPRYDDLSKLQNNLQHLVREGVEAPLPRSLIPSEGRPALRVKREGGWVSWHNAEIADHRAKRAA